MPSRPSPRYNKPLLAGLLALLAVTTAGAQSFCSSDGKVPPARLLERFVNADCEDCWRDPATLAARSRELALDWVLPGSRGEDAPLAAVATRDAQWRLEALGRPAVPAADVARAQVGPGGPRLRVAQGLAFNDYVAASVQLRAASGRGPWRVWLLLVETLPAGMEGSPVARALVRNALEFTWDGRSGQGNRKPGAATLREIRPMRVPEGAKPERLRVVGMVQDARGRLVGLAQTACAAASS